MGWFTNFRRKFSSSTPEAAAPTPEAVVPPVSDPAPEPAPEREPEVAAAPEPQVEAEAEAEAEAEPEPEPEPEPVQVSAVPAPEHVLEPELIVDAEPVPAEEVTPEPEPAADPQVERTVIDLSAVDSVRVRVLGTETLVPADERHDVRSVEYLLVREPAESDAFSSVAVFNGERKVGYLSSAKADLLVPLLDRLPADAFQIVGDLDATRPDQFWAFIPRIPALRAHALLLLVDTSAS